MADTPTLHLNDQLKRGLITFDQWLIAKNLEEKAMLASLVDQGVLSEEQFNAAMSAQKTTTISSMQQQQTPPDHSHQTVDDDEAQHKEVCLFLFF